MIEVALEDEEVGLGEVEEKIRSFGGEVPLLGEAGMKKRARKNERKTYEGVSSTPEGVLFVDPFAFTFILLPALTHEAKGFEIGL